MRWGFLVEFSGNAVRLFFIDESRLVYQQVWLSTNVYKDAENITVLRNDLIPEKERKFFTVSLCGDFKTCVIAKDIINDVMGHDNAKIVYPKNHKGGKIYPIYWKKLIGLKRGKF